MTGPERESRLRCHCREIIYDVEMGIRTCGHPDHDEVCCPQCQGDGAVDANGVQTEPDATGAEGCPLCEAFGQVERWQADEAMGLPHA